MSLTRTPISSVLNRRLTLQRLKPKDRRTLSSRCLGLYYNNKLLAFFEESDLFDHEGMRFEMDD